MTKTIEISEFEYDNSKNGILIFETDASEVNEEKAKRLVINEIKKTKKTVNTHDVEFNFASVSMYLDDTALTNDDDGYNEYVSREEVKFAQRFHLNDISKLIHITETNGRAKITSTLDNPKENDEIMRSMFHAYLDAYVEGYPAGFANGEWGMFDEEFEPTYDVILPENVSTVYQQVAYVHGYVDGQIYGYPDGYENR